MDPSITNGSIVIVVRIPFLLRTIKKGDIVAARRQNKIVIKRIAKVENGKFFLQGDNTHDSLDSRTFGLIERKQIIGKVIPFILAS